MTDKIPILVDLDGTLATYTKWEGLEIIGDPIPGAKTFLNLLAKSGPITIFTNRCCASINDRAPEELQEIIIKWLEKHNLHYDNVWIGQGKPFGIIVDDNAVQCRPQERGLSEYGRVVTEVERIIGGYMGTK